MPVSTRYPTTDIPVTGTWSNPTNVQADDGAVAAITRGTTKNSQDNREQAGYGFDGVIPSDAVIDQVDLEVEHRVASTANVCFLENLAYVSGVAGAVNSDSLEPTVLTARVYANYARPGGGGWTRNDLLDANFKTRIRARNGNNATSNTWEWDYIRVKVTYTVPPPSISSAAMADVDRDWDVPYQDITVVFSEAMDITPSPNVGDTVLGLTAQVNAGANVALTYRSGNATATWVVRRAELIQQNDTVVLDYDQVAGVILTVANDTELDTTVDKAVTNNLTKRARAILKDKNNAVLNAVTVKYAIQEYDSGVPANANWLTRTNKGTAVTTAAGLLDVQYTGATAVGSNVYLTVIQPDTTPTEAMVWPQLVE